ncbi:cytidylyltransferase domain-containing protein [Niveispirillum fermenti]|uniref:cytidylyltransferase domain-containing protein n=1 Tax=Niveispirillum fermenti TaxID=1233113 RepID=UPI003A86B186
MIQAAPRVIGVIQARMGSTRLPGKVMMQVAGKSLIAHQVERLRRCRRLDGLCLATSDRPGDDALADHAAALDVPVFRGSETDVLDRFYRAAYGQGADIAVRFTGDCPLIDPALVDTLVALHDGTTPPPDYAAIDVSRYPRGLDAELVSMGALQAAWTDAQEDFEREHVLPFIWRRPERFRLSWLTDPDLDAPWRWCVDTEQDLLLVRHLLEWLLPVNPAFGWRDADGAMRAHPEWAAINREVVQKTLPPCNSEGA